MSWSKFQTWSYSGTNKSYQRQFINTFTDIQCSALLVKHDNSLLRHNCVQYKFSIHYIQ